MPQPSEARISELAADLATAIGIVSAIRTNTQRLIAFGEVGLQAVRACTGVRRRIQEAARPRLQGRHHSCTGSEEAMGMTGITVLPISDLAGAPLFNFPSLCGY